MSGRGGGGGSDFFSKKIKLGGTSIRDLRVPFNHKIYSS